MSITIPINLCANTKITSNKLNVMKLKSFFKTKYTINRKKWQPTKWENIFTNYISDRRLTSKIYKEHKFKNPNNTI